MKYVYGFDVDGVLCDRGKTIDKEFKEWFLNWSVDKEYYIITGSHREKTILQISEQIVKNAKLAFHCLGNSIWIDDHEVVVNNFLFKEEELDFLNNCILQSNFSIKTGNHFDYRKGSVNFSIIGKNASHEQRLQYVQYDEQSKERIQIIEKFTKRFPRFDAFIGGDVSIDICLTGANKKLILNLCDFRDCVFHYFGDRCFKYGADYPLRLALERTKHVWHQINNGYSETKDILERL